MRLALLISLLASLLVESFLKPRPRRYGKRPPFYGARRNHIAIMLYVTSSPSMEIAEEVSRCELYVRGCVPSAEEGLLALFWVI